MGSSEDLIVLGKSIFDEIEKGIKQYSFLRMEIKGSWADLKG